MCPNFFDNLDPEATPKGLPHGGRNRVVIDLVRNFLEIPDEDARTALAHLVKALKGHTNGQPEETAPEKEREYA
jgi:hypothetical protein